MVHQSVGQPLPRFDGRRGLHGVREGVAKNLDIPASKVRVICTHMGGGFGSKLQAGHYSAVAARLSKQAGAPVKLMLSRKQDFLGVGNRPNSIQKLKLGAKKDGKITALEAITYGTSGVGTGANVTVPFVYEFTNWHHKHHDVFTNAGGGRPFRAPGRPQAAFAMEQLMDEMAEKIGMDALEFRMKNDTNQTRQKEWRIAAEKIDWANRKKKPGSDRGPVKTGVGMGASIWGAGGGGTKASMKVFPDGGVEIRIGTQDLGTGSRTLIAAIVAEELGLEVNQVLSLVGDSEFPRSGGSGGSTTSPSVSPAAKNTAEKARGELTKLAAAHFKVDSSDITWQRGSVALASDPNQKLSWKDLCKLLENEHLEVQMLIGSTRLQYSRNLQGDFISEQDGLTHWVFGTKVFPGRFPSEYNGVGSVQGCSRIALSHRVVEDLQKGGISIKRLFFREMLSTI